MMTDSYTAKDVAALTGWKHECVTHWCKLGLLNSSRARRGGADTFDISAKDLVEFQKRYVVLADLARDLGTSSRALRLALLEKGAEIIGEKATEATTRCALVRTSSMGNTLSV